MDYSVIVINAVLCIPVYFLWRWILKRLIENSSVRIFTTWIATVISTPVIYVAIIVLWMFSVSYYQEHRFTKQKWDTDKEMRFELSNDVIKSRMLIGKSKSEVKRILGDEGNSDESNQWTYYLGFRPQLFNIDPDVLDIEFKDGVVVRVSQHET